MLSAHAVNSIHYLETSAVNFFADRLGVSDFARDFLRVSKVDWCVSSIVLWEVLLNGDERRRDYLIYWLQEMSAGYLLKSPSELLAAYLRAGTPQNDKKQFWCNRETGSTLGETWAAIHRKPDRTILADVAGLEEMSQHVRDLAKMHRSLILAMTDESEDGYDRDAFHRAMLDLQNSLGRKSPPTKDREKQLKTALILTFFFVCIGLDLENQPIRDYWKEIGIDHSEPFVRLYYLIEHNPRCFIRGPLAEMSLMVEHQAFVAGTPNRGML